MAGYKTVYDLDEAEIHELKEAYYDLLKETDDDNEFMFPEEIPDVVVLEHYDGILFTDDDFFCNASGADDMENRGAAYIGI